MRVVMYCLSHTSRMAADEVPDRLLNHVVPIGRTLILIDLDSDYLSGHLGHFHALRWQVSYDLLDSQLRDRYTDYRGFIGSKAFGWYLCDLACGR